MSFMLWIFCLTVLFFGLRLAVRPLHRMPFFKMLLLPGVLFATLTKLLAGAASRSKLKAVHAPWRSGEPVVHERSPIPIFGPAVKAILPFLAALTLVIYLQSALEPSFRGVEQLPALEASSNAAAALRQAASDVVQSARTFVSSIGSGDWLAVLFVYLAGSIFVYAAPNLREFGILALAAALSIFPVVAIDWLGLEPGFLSRAWFIKRSYGPAAFQIVAMLFSLALLTTLTALVTQVLTYAMRFKMKPKMPEKAAAREKAHAH